MECFKPQQYFAEEEILDILQRIENDVPSPSKDIDVVLNKDGEILSSSVKKLNDKFIKLDEKINVKNILISYQQKFT